MQDPEHIWPAAREEYASKRADGSIKDRPRERMFSAHFKDDDHDHAEG
ncbi:hypothetical protein EWI07_11655 [Sporolactobacillus sp. THM7-4]|nr:hypothetical protein EWI07_11655 [Sporolactobacillus sp. THM7-4]